MSRARGVDTSSGPPRSEFYEALLREAEALFSQRGYRGASTREISQRAGCSEALVFRHFGSKENLFQQAVLDPFDQAIAGYVSAGSDWREPVDGGRPGDSPRYRLLETEIERLFHVMTTHRSLFRCLIASSGIQEGPALIRAGGGSPLRPIFDHLEKVLSVALPRPALETLDSPLSARACVALVMSSAVLDDWLFEGRTHPAPARIVEELRQLIIFGCTARPTREPSTPPGPEPLPPPRPVQEREPGVVRRDRTTNRRRRSRHDVREAVLVSARELFSSRGYAGVTTQEIATLAQVSETSVYRHYKSKRALFEQAIFAPFQEWIITYLASWDRSNRTLASLEQQARVYVTDTYDMLAGSRGLVRSMIASSTLEVEGQPTPLAEVAPLRDILLRLEHQVAELAERNGLPGMDVEITVAATFGMVLSFAALPDWMFDDAGAAPSRTRLTNEMAALMAFGTAAR